MDPARLAMLGAALAGAFVIRRQSHPRPAPAPEIEVEVEPATPWSEFRFGRGGPLPPPITAGKLSKERQWAAEEEEGEDRRSRRREDEEDKIWPLAPSRGEAALMSASMPDVIGLDVARTAVERSSPSPITGASTGYETTMTARRAAIQYQRSVTPVGAVYRQFIRR